MLVIRKVDSFHPNQTKTKNGKTSVKTERLTISLFWNSTVFLQISFLLYKYFLKMHRTNAVSIVYNFNLNHQ